ncbi:Cation-transporting P-type ATPase [Artemisia annua]|uniref:Cation-transporting P-type ATPase n=1 Tax=Artemisia annua TaxID=35608 RepID=A0A2U1MTS5_ARTAN|nr:Cation-transporting P-type ATPase [Artemisia annua]
MLIRGFTKEPGNVLKALPGKKVHVDGHVVWHSSHVNGSTVTGEYAHAVKEVDSLVIGVLINFNDLLHVRATKIGSDTILSHIISLVETTQMSKAPIQNFADYGIQMRYCLTRLDFFVSCILTENVNIYSMKYEFYLNVSVSITFFNSIIIFTIFFAGFIMAVSYLKEVNSEKDKWTTCKIAIDMAEQGDFEEALLMCIFGYKCTRIFWLLEIRESTSSNQNNGQLFVGIRVSGGTDGISGHGAWRGSQPFPWKTRLEVAIGLKDDEFDAIISDIELNVLPDAGKGHITTRMMGTFIPLANLLVQV